MAARGAFIAAARPQPARERAGPCTSVPLAPPRWRWRGLWRGPERVSSRFMFEGARAVRGVGRVVVADARSSTGQILPCLSIAPLRALG